MFFSFIIFINLLYVEALQYCLIHTQMLFKFTLFAGVEMHSVLSKLFCKRMEFTFQLISSSFVAVKVEKKFCG